MGYAVKLQRAGKIDLRLNKNDIIGVLSGPKQSITMPKPGALVGYIYAAGGAGGTLYINDNCAAGGYRANSRALVPGGESAGYDPFVPLDIYGLALNKGDVVRTRMDGYYGAYGITIYGFMSI